MVSFLGRLTITIIANLTHVLLLSTCGFGERRQLQLSRQLGVGVQAKDEVRRGKRRQAGLQGRRVVGGDATAVRGGVAAVVDVEAVQLVVLRPDWRRCI